MHNYGPHYFRTNNGALLDYLSSFTEWIPGNYKVKCSIDGQLYPFPINLTTLELFFNRNFTSGEANAYVDDIREDFDRITNSEEFVLSRVGRELYERFYLGYTLKQWNIHPRDLAASVCGRIPVRFTRDDRYVDHKHQVIPKNGYTRMFQKMLDHPNIHVMLDTDFHDVRDQIRPRHATLFTGPVDEYFDKIFGPLPYRSLIFETVVSNTDLVQPCVQINYPNDFSWTRTVEYKHITGQHHPKTIIVREIPCVEGDPYYPIPTSGNSVLYGKYKELADKETREKRVFFCGRLAEYAYLNMDEVMEKALVVFENMARAVQESKL